MFGKIYKKKKINFFPLYYKWGEQNLYPDGLLELSRGSNGSVELQYSRKIIN